MKKLILAAMLAAAGAVNAAIWEGVTDENHVAGPKLTPKSLMGKAVVVFHLDGGETCKARAERAEKLWGAHDKKRFLMVATTALGAEAGAKAAADAKITFPVYRDLKPTADPKRRTGGTMVVIDHYGRLVTVSSDDGDREFEEQLVGAISQVGMLPDLIPGVSLDKYKSLKKKIKFGANVAGIVKSLEKDVKAAEKKTATKVQKAKAEEAAEILAAITKAKSEIAGNLKALAEANPAEAYKLMSLYVKSFPDLAAEYKPQLDELKAKAAADK